MAINLKRKEKEIERKKYVKYLEDEALGTDFNEAINKG
jgi:hypothetical protein